MLDHHQPILNELNLVFDGLDDSLINSHTKDVEIESGFGDGNFVNFRRWRRYATVTVLLYGLGAANLINLGFQRRHGASAALRCLLGLRLLQELHWSFSYPLQRHLQYSQDDAGCAAFMGASPSSDSGISTVSSYTFLDDTKGSLELVLAANTSTNSRGDAFCLYDNWRT